MSVLLENELIDDRALTDVSDDRFRHEDFASELADLVSTVETPANIALFAPWGSGKTGLANLLERKLAARPGWGTNLRFARFDAFKYAEAPLRRNFIAETARQLGVHDDQFDEGLYRSTTSSTLKLNWRQLRNLAKAFGIALMTVGALIGLVLVVLALSLDGETKTNLDELFRKNLISAIPLAAFISGLVALALPGLTLTATRAAPSTEEEFEKRFTELLSKVHANRIVVFIDELDRCGPDEVASTLETIKTFLEVPSCIFVVAADHQVLEQALRKRVRQETPHDITNPYYSAGSSYLDKVFQFQVALPQLMPRRLTGFALDLVRDRGGVWSRLTRIEDVVSVLIPTHVTSPRRVKVLLNSFALTYRLAERRAESGELGANLPERGAEVARLVCLRCEFPLFAAEIERDVRLVSLVQRFAAMERDGEPAEGAVQSLVAGGLPSTLVDRARSFYAGERPVAELLATDDAREDRPEGAHPMRDAPQGDEVRRAHAEQLVRYLLRTSHVPGPYSDLVHLESSGAGLALDPADAQELQRAAADNDLASIRETISRLNDAERPDALRLLAGEVAAAFPGIEGDNVTSTLLQTVALFPDALPPAVDTVAAAVVQHQRRAGLRAESFAGAMLLGRVRGGDMGDRLRDQVLARPEALDTQEVRRALIVDADRLPTHQHEFLAQATTSVLLGDPAARDAVLGATSSNAFNAALTASGELIAKRVQRHYQASGVLAREDPEQTEEQAEELRLDLLAHDPAATLGGLIDYLLDEEREPDAQRVATIVLSANHRDMRSAIERRLDRFGTIKDERLLVELLNATWVRHVAAWPAWLEVVASQPIPLSDAERASVERLSLRLWDLTTQDDPPTDEEVDAALRALKAVLKR